MQHHTPRWMLVKLIETLGDELFLCWSVMIRCYIDKIRLGQGVRLFNEIYSAGESRECVTSLSLDVSHELDVTEKGSDSIHFSKAADDEYALLGHTISSPSHPDNEAVYLKTQSLSTLRRLECKELENRTPLFVFLRTAKLRLRQARL